MENWLAENWFQIIGTVFGGGLLFTGFSIYKEAKARQSEVKARRVANLLAITANHRELWKEYFRHPTLARVIDSKADVAQNPITGNEEIFMNMVISHTSSTYEALKDEMLKKQVGLQRDVKSFFSRPIPNAVWQKTKPLQNQDFADFIESALK